MKREVLSLALPLVLLAVAPAHAATKISQFGYTITAPGVYEVTQDLSGSGNAITILASNVDLHLGGHTLTGSGFGVGVDVEGPAGNSVTIDHGTVQVFENGILLDNALNCKVSSVTATQNGHDGILLIFATANTVTDNTVSQNQGGIELSNSNGNTITHNTTAQNYYGITVADSSSGNTVVHNTATRNIGYGIVLRNFATQNAVQDNACTGSQVGIDLGANAYGGNIGDTIQRNTVNLNQQGIVIEVGYPQNSGNTIQGNTAAPNTLVDLEDDNVN